MSTPRLILLPTLVLASFFGPALARVDAKLPVGLQLWSLREEFKKDAQHALDLTKGFGFAEVETAGTAGMSAADFLAALKSRGLKPVSAHVQYPALEKDVAEVVNEAKTLGVSYAFCPWIPHEGAFDAATAKKAAENFNKWGAAFRAAGIKFGYHPHGYEFVPGSKPGTTMFDELAQMTEPQNVSFQMDVFWVYRAAADPIPLLKKYPNRWVSLHIKDLRKGAERIPGSSSTPASDKVVIGTGQINWQELLGTAKAQGINHFVLEDESEAPLKQIPQSMVFLNTLKL